MTSFSAERLYGLLPSIYRARDAEHGEPLRALVAAFAMELAGLEENLAQLYDDQFIETCAEWVVPYLGDLLGYRSLEGPTAAIASPRAEVANTIRYRRRKGTAAMLEQLARDVTGCPAHVVEYFERLSTTQYMKHVRLHAPATARLSGAGVTPRLRGAFDRLPHTVDVRHPETSGGRYNIPNIGIFLWRLESLRLSGIPLTAHPGDPTGRKYRVNPLGADLRLFRRARSEDDVSQLSEPAHVPEPLSRRLLALSVRRAQSSTTSSPNAVLDDDYGSDESLAFFEGAAMVGVERVRVCDLGDIVDPGTGNVIAWNHELALAGDQIGIDPERGRVLLGPNVAEPPLVTFHYGSVRSIGGGEYERGEAFAPEPNATPGSLLQPRLDSVVEGGQVVIGDSWSYRETLVFRVAGASAATPGVEVVVAASNGARPLIASNGEVRLEIGARGKLVLEGLVIGGGTLRLLAANDTEERELVLRDCTLVPGLTLAPDGSALSPGAPSLIVEHPFTKVTFERCITGSLRVGADAEVILRNSIVDAGAPESVAFTGVGASEPGGALVVDACTVIGKVHTQRFTLGSNSIFHARLAEAASETWRAPLIAERRQEGCLRFSYVPEGSIVPRRHACVPSAAHPQAFPEFSSLRYGDARYGQLRDATHAALRLGAEHGAEMGVLHELYHPIRENNLRVRLDEYLRFGLHAGIFHAT